MLTANKTYQILTVLATATPVNVFTYLTFVVKGTVLISLVFAILTVFASIRRPKGIYSKAMASHGWWALSFSLFGMAYSGLNSYLGLVGGSNPYGIYQITAAVIACAYVLLPGLMAWLFASVANAGTRKL